MRKFVGNLFSSSISSSSSSHSKCSLANRLNIFFTLTPSLAPSLVTPKRRRTATTTLFTAQLFSSLFPSSRRSYEVTVALCSALKTAHVKGRQKGNKNNNKNRIKESRSNGKWRKENVEECTTFILFDRVLRRVHCSFAHPFLIVSYYNRDEDKQ